MLMLKYRMTSRKAVGSLLIRSIFDKPSKDKNNNTKGKNYG